MGKGKVEVTGNLQNYLQTANHNRRKIEEM
jgi:hypothetical protein